MGYQDCPKCKGYASVEVRYSDEWGEWFAECKDCRARFVVHIILTPREWDEK
jgi:hypothetical protein